MDAILWKYVVQQNFQLLTPQVWSLLFQMSMEIEILHQSL